MNQMNELKPPEKGYESRMRTNALRLYRWSGAWVAATVLMVNRILAHKALVFTLLAVGLNVAVGVGMILAFKKLIAEADELQRNLLLNAFAIAFGVGVVAGIPFTVMSAFRVIPVKANIGHLVILMGVAFIVSLLYGNRRYR
jgi:hypothetical protein